MSRLALVRHGATAWNQEGRLQGQEDIGLSPQGRSQVAALGPVVAALGAIQVVRSPLRRCAQTAAVLGLHGQSDPRWMEADLGEWTGRTRSDLLATGDGRYEAWRAGERVPPGAETLAQVRARVGAALESVRAVLRPGTTTLVITHGGPIRAVCHLLLGLETGQLVPVAPASLTVLDLAGPRPRLAAYGVTGEGAAASREAIPVPGAFGLAADAPD